MFKYQNFSANNYNKLYFQAVNEQLSERIRTAPFWVITQWIEVISYGCFGTTLRSHLQGSRIQKKACCPNMEFM